MLFELLAQLLDFLLDVPHFCHFADNFCIGLNDARGARVQSDWTCEHEFEKLETSVQLVQQVIAGCGCIPAGGRRRF